jgi:hypothetical protein
MFERFTQDARRVVVLAQEEARRLNHNYIGTEHVLLGLANEDEGVAGRALESFGVSLERARAEVAEMVGVGQTVPTGHIPFTPEAKKVLELSLREALQMGHSYMGTAHILLGVVREGDGVGAQILVKLTPGLQQVRERVLELLAEGGGVAEAEPQAARVARPPAAGVAGGPGTFVGSGIHRGPEPPELVRVVPLAREVYRGAGFRMVLMSLEVWSGWLDLRYALLPERPPPTPPVPDVALDWQVADDTGTGYELTGVASSGGRLLRVHQWTFQPAPPSQARTITLTLRDDEASATPLAVVEIQLAASA